MMICFATGSLAEEEAAPLKKVVILATGGTIAGVGDAGKTAGYEPGSLTAEELIAAVPALDDVAQIEAIQICNVNSYDITDRIWLQLADSINDLAADPDVAGFVITHGTDTLEETAYFLNLTVKTDKPVVISSRIGDGIIIPENLLCENTIAADNLSPQRAAILLRLALTRTTDHDQLQGIFSDY